MKDDQDYAHVTALISTAPTVATRKATNCASFTPTTLMTNPVRYRA